MSCRTDSQRKSPSSLIESTSLACILASGLLVVVLRERNFVAVPEVVQSRCNFSEV